MINILTGDGLSVYVRSDTIYFEYKKCICPHMEKLKGNLDLACECAKMFTVEIIKAIYTENAEIELIKTIMLDEDGCMVALKLKL